METQQSKNVKIWECDNCGHVTYNEEDDICYQCGVGNICYKGTKTIWVDAEPLPCPTRWDVFKETLNIMWNKYAGDPDDPNSFGVNLLGTIFWAFILGLILMGMVIFT